MIEPEHGDDARASCVDRRGGRAGAPARRCCAAPPTRASTASRSTARRSTSDTVLLLANGARGQRAAARRRRAAARAALRGALARGLPRSSRATLARDGEGATQARDGARRAARARAAEAERAARRIANSMLVKTALFGGDPNWGRILQTVGAARVRARAARAREVAARRAWRSSATAPRPGRRRGARAARALRGAKEVEIAVDLGAGRGRGDGLDLRPHLRLRPDQRGVHDLARGSADSAGCARVASARAALLTPRHFTRSGSPQRCPASGRRRPRRTREPGRERRRHRTGAEAEPRRRSAWPETLRRGVRRPARPQPDPASDGRAMVDGLHADPLDGARRCSRPASTSATRRAAGTRA